MALGFTEQGYHGVMRRGSDLLATKLARIDMSFDEVAQFHLRAGEIDRALDWLERGYQAHDPNLPYINCNHQLQPQLQCSAEPPALQGSGPAVGTPHVRCGSNSGYFVLHSLQPERPWCYTPRQENLVSGALARSFPTP
jgi:hypothetical protein